MNTNPPSRPQDAPKGDIQKFRKSVRRPLENMEERFYRWLPRNFHSLWAENNWFENLNPFESSLPAVDMVDRDKDVLLKVEVPGMERDDIEVLVGDRSLTLRGTHTDNIDEQEGKILQQERRTQSFTRTLILPDHVDADKVEASCRNGLLEIILPKIEPCKKKKITIK